MNNLDRIRNKLSPERRRKIATRAIEILAGISGIGGNRKLRRTKKKPNLRLSPPATVRAVVKRATPQLGSKRREAS